LEPSDLIHGLASYPRANKLSNKLEFVRDTAMARKILVASMAAVAISGTALAADLSYRAPPAAYVPPAWSGRGSARNPK
jgi:hypothetical protein